MKVERLVRKMLFDLLSEPFFFLEFKRALLFMQVRVIIMVDIVVLFDLLDDMQTGLLLMGIIEVMTIMDLEVIVVRILVTLMQNVFGMLDIVMER
jgi:hypothetical protein